MYGTGLALAARSVLSGRRGRHGFLRGRHGAWRHIAKCRRGALRHPPSFHVAGMARMALGWLWRRARFSAVAVVAAVFCVAGMALGDI